MTKAKATGHWPIGGKLTGIFSAASVLGIVIFPRGCHWSVRDSGWCMQRAPDGLMPVATCSDSAD
jgi:hypothetical protein